VSGCGDTLFFAERESFKLAIHLNENPIAPLQVNAGVKRTVLTVAPPQGGITKTEGGTTQAEGDAVNMFSGFDLHYTPSTGSPFAGKLAIKTQFASGTAALAIASDPTLVETIMGAGRFVPLSPALVARKSAANKLLAAPGSQPKIDAIARDLKINPGAGARRRIEEQIRAARSDEAFKPIADALKKNLGQGI
jgi:hypothetical protein